MVPLEKVGFCSPIEIAAFCNTDFPPLSFKVIDELLLPLIDFEKSKKRNSPSMNAAATHTEEEQELFFSLLLHSYFFCPGELQLIWRAGGQTDGRRM